MAKEDVIVCEGVVSEVLPNAMFKVKLDTNNHVILSHLSGKMRMNNINVLLGDAVRVEMTIYDTQKGRIVFRDKKTSNT